MINYRDKWDDPNYIFAYDENSKSCLRWRNRKATDSKLIGKECGTKNKWGGWSVQFRGAPKPIHRIIWEMFNGPFEDIRDTVGFYNNDFSDVRITNLYINRYKDKNWQDNYLINGQWDRVFKYIDGVLYWEGTRWSGKSLSRLASKHGDPVKIEYDKDGYCRHYIIACGKNPLRVHSIVYELHYGKIPDDMVVDHIDGDILNNKIENLRCVTKNTNARNTKISSRNKTGVLGVRVREQEHSKVYIAIWRDDNKSREKSFSVKKYGEKQAFKLACEYRDKMIAKLNQKLGDEGYHENHGKR